MSFSIRLTGRDAAGVERTHGELRAGFADGLGGDDADRQAFLDELVGATCRCRSSVAQMPRGLSHVSGERTRMVSSFSSLSLSAISLVMIWFSATIVSSVIGLRIVSRAVRPTIMSFNSTSTVSPL